MKILILWQLTFQTVLWLKHLNHFVSFSVCCYLGNHLCSSSLQLPPFQITNTLFSNFLKKKLASIYLSSGDSFSQNFLVWHSLSLLLILELFYTRNKWSKVETIPWSSSVGFLFQHLLCYWRKINEQLLNGF